MKVIFYPLNGFLSIHVMFYLFCFSQDSDSDDEPKIKKTKSSAGAAGFLGSLPAPRGSGGGKDTGRTFIPYTLTKSKPAAAKPTPAAVKPKSKKPNVVSKLTEAYSDSDEEVSQTEAGSGASTNFFSLSSESKPTVTGIAGGINATPSVVNNAPSSNEVEETRPRITAASLYNMSGDNDYSSMDTGYTEPYMETSSSNKQVDDLLQNEQVGIGNSLLVMWSCGTLYLNITKGHNFTQTSPNLTAVI